ncbi:MAG: GNAT family N-acetyltransferase [Roseiflexaceae bacterium]
MSFAIRPYHPSDLYSLYRICLLTGDSGQDAAHLYRDPELLGHYFAAPYGVYEPETCFILTQNHAPCGYVLAARDTEAFWKRCDQEWFPQLRERYPLTLADDKTHDSWMIRAIHEDHTPSAEDLAFYATSPAHLHIDLLPHAQGQGMGGRMIATLIDRLRSLGIAGVHLGVGVRNERAIRFYEKVGFQLVERHEGHIVYGMAL